MDVKAVRALDVASALGEGQQVSCAYHCLWLYLCPPSSPIQAPFCKTGMPIVISNRRKLRPGEIRRLM